MAESNRGKKRKKPLVLSEVMEKAKRLIVSDGDESEPPPSSSSSTPAKRRRAPATYHFLKDSLTGQRITHCVYRPRQSKPVPSTLLTAIEEEDNELDIEATVSDIEHSASPFSDEPVTSSETADLAGILQAANGLLQEWRKTKVPKQNWVQRTSILNESWAALRGSLFNTVVSGQAMAKTSCMKCSKNLAVVRCLDCHTHTRLCGHCDQLVHNFQPFHDRGALTSGFLKPIPPTVSLDCDGKWISVDRLLPSSHVCLVCPSCNSNNIQTVGKQNHCVVVTLRGRFDLNHVLFQCLECNKELPTGNPAIVTQLGFWPGSVKNMTYIFDQEVFLHWDLFQKESPGSSERSFLKSLEQFSLRKGRVGTISSKAFGTAFKEWKYCQYELDRLRYMDWMKCPACEENQHSVHVDGNMKLYRFKSAGLRQRECYYGDAFIASNQEVDRHIQKVYQGSKQSTTKEPDQNKCGDTSWRAAGNTLRKKKNLCETGLEIAGCRHSIAQKAVNMMYGEIYGYGHYLQTAYFIPKQVQYFWYDVVCKYWPWLKKHDSRSAQNMKPALSVMHAKAHSWSCQVIWGGRWQNGASATTGEEVEQINSHFSRLGTSTKHMLPEGREELLTEHAFQWNRKKIEKLPIYLAKRYSKTKIQITNVKKELLQQLDELHIKADVLTDWQEEVYRAAQDEQNSQTASRIAVISKDEEELLLKTVCSQNENLSVGQKILLEKAIAYYQKKMESYHFSISQMIYNMGKLGDSSKQRQRIRRKVSLDRESLKTIVSKYNQLVGETSTVLPEKIEKGEFPWQLADDSRNDSVSLSTKRSAVDKQMEVNRYKEELLLIKKEMIGFMSYYKDGILPSIQKQKTELKASLSGSQTSDLADYATEGERISGEVSGCAESTPDELVTRGKISLLEEGKNFALRQIASGLNAFASVLSDELDSFRELAVDSEGDAGEADEGTESTDEWIAEDDDHDDHEDNDETDVRGQEDGAEATNTDSELEEFSKIVDELQAFPPLHAVHLSEGLCLWQFPGEISQSTFNGRNGSNACSLISLLFAYIFSRKGIQIPPEGLLPNNILRIFCGCIELGNRMYDICRDSLPCRYLSVQEAATLLSFTNISATQPLPVRLEDDHELSTVCGQLSNLSDNRTYFVNIVINEKTSLFIVSPPEIMYIDTHRHGSNGAVIVKGTTANLRAFCQFVWELETHEKNTYGNLCTLLLS